MPTVTELANTFLQEGVVLLCNRNFSQAQAYLLRSAALGNPWAKDLCAKHYGVSYPGPDAKTNADVVNHYWLEDMRLNLMRLNYQQAMPVPALVAVLPPNTVNATSQPMASVASQSAPESPPGPRSSNLAMLATLAAGLLETAAVVSQPGRGTPRNEATFMGPGRGTKRTAAEARIDEAAAEESSPKRRQRFGLANRQQVNQ